MWLKTLKIKISTVKKIFIFTGIFIFLSIFFFISSIFLFYQNSSLKTKTDDLEKGIRNTKAICISQANKKIYDTSPLSPQVQEEEEEIEDPLANKENMPENIKVDQTTDALIEVSNVQKLVDPNAQSITLSFQLKHVKNTSDSSISGYVILIGKNDDIANPVYSTYPPNIELNDIFPSDYRQGERFYIKNLKHVQAKIPLKNKNSTINEIIIYVFSAVGEMLLEKSITIGDDDEF